MKIVALLLALATQLCSAAEPQPWRIAIIGDTHDSPPSVAGNCGVAVDFIRSMYKQILPHKPDMVIQVGDLADTQEGDSPNKLKKRAELNDVLKEKGIPFYCVRGNHDDTPIRAKQFPTLFIPKGKNVIRNGLNYAVTHKNASLYFLDVEQTPEQLVKFSEWLKQTRGDLTKAPKHCLLFTHRTLYTPQNFRECLWGKRNDTAPEEQNTFYRNLTDAGCRLVITAHLHHHNLFTITSPDGKHKLTSLICVQAGNKILPTPILPPEKTRVTAHRFCSLCTGFYILTVYPTHLTLDTYVAPYDGVADQCPQEQQFLKLPTDTIPIP